MPNRHQYLSYAHYIANYTYSGSTYLVEHFNFQPCFEVYEYMRKLQGIPTMITV